MFEPADTVYLYDGGFAGFLCCVFASYQYKEIPLDIRPWSVDLPLFGARRIETDRAKAHRAADFIRRKTGQEAWRFLRRAFFTCLPGKERCMLDFIFLGRRRGPGVMDMLTDERLNALHKAVRRLERETEHYRGFVRFSLYRGVMLAAIRPENFVLPFLGRHFKERFPNERFLIYDRARCLALICSDGIMSVKSADGFTPPDVSGEELAWRGLWRLFYSTISIKERENPLCRRSHMPKRYWADMTEFQTDAPPKDTRAGLNEVSAVKSGSCQKPLLAGRSENILPD
jgi:probable DNA metabolism protein